MIATLVRSAELERDLHAEKANLDKEIKLTTSSNTLSNIVNQGANRKREIGFYSVYPAYNLFSKYVLVKDNLLCFHYGKNRHTMNSCPAKVVALKELR